jgi:DNA-binding beta-propeller fold protein YncE
MGETHRPGRFFNRLPRGKVVALALSASALLLITATALAATGDLIQPAGTAGCISEDGTGPCADGHALGGPSGVAVSRDGKSVYVIAGVGGEGAIARLNRNTTTGALTQPAGTAGCISETGAGPCANGRALNGAYSVAISPDGKSVYVASNLSYAVARFNRNTTTGALTQPAGTAGCISQGGFGGCANGHGLEYASAVAVSPDGKSVYVGGSTVARLNRNTTTGALTQPAGTAGCISQPGYEAEPCADGHALEIPYGVAVSPDGKSVYVASGYSNAVARLVRNPTTGAITQPAGTAGCISETGAGPCANGRGLDGAQSVAVSADRKSVYVASSFSNAVARLNRNTTTGAITQPAGTAGCISETGAGPCANGRGLDGTWDVAVSPNGKSVYVASLFSDAVARFNRAP